MTTGEASRRLREAIGNIRCHGAVLWSVGQGVIMSIAVIGTGYVGLVSGACFSEFGVNVVCVDKDSDKIARLQRGEMPIYEPGLDQLVESNVRAGRLSFSTDTATAGAQADAVFLARGTAAR